MFAKLKDHPFAVEAFFESSVVLTFAVPRAQLERLIPECLTLDLLHEEWGFIAVAMVQTKHLRPKGFPQFMGNDFFLTGYRVFVRYTNNAGKRLRGLYILRSQTDKKKMELLGNLFTHYNYTTTDITRTMSGDTVSIDSVGSGLHVAFSNNAYAPLPAMSPFADWKEARRYAGPLPFTFTYNKPQKEVLIIEGVRENWEPKPIEIVNYAVPLLQEIRLEGCILANAFIIENIPYYWKKGVIEKWNR